MHNVTQRLSPFPDSLNLLIKLRLLPNKLLRIDALPCQTSHDPRQHGILTEGPLHMHLVYTITPLRNTKRRSRALAVELCISAA